MTRRTLYWIFVGAVACALVGFGAPSWAALGAGLVLALAIPVENAKVLKRWTTWALQLGIIALGAGMNLGVVLRVGSTGLLVTASTIALAFIVGRLLAKLFHVEGNTGLLISMGTAICGGSAIAAVASVIDPEEHETSVALGVVFVLNAIGLLLFPVIGHLLDLSQPVFGRWAALAIHDTSSVVGAGREYGAIALMIATTTKLARALWIAPLTVVIAFAKRRGNSLSSVKWPYFILGFIVMAALATWVPSMKSVTPTIFLIGQRLLVLALFLIGLSLSRRALARVGSRPLLMGVVLWIIVAAASLPLALLPHIR